MQQRGSASTSGLDEAVALVSPAWLRHGPKGMFGRVEPGLLVALEVGTIRFATHTETVFDAGRNEIGVKWPWWEFGAGVHLRVAGKIHRLSLTPPPNGADINLTRIGSIGAALASGKAWKKYLGGET